MCCVNLIGSMNCRSQFSVSETSAFSRPFKELSDLSERHSSPSSRESSGEEIRSLKPSPSPASRRRTAVACVSCHRMKVCCDAPRPCSRCTKLGRAKECVDRPHKRKGRPPKHSPTKAKDHFSKLQSLSKVASQLTELSVPGASIC